MPSSQNFFQNAHHFEVNDGQFFNIENANTTIITNTPKDDSDPVSTTLCQYVATGATFDSAERYPPGKCHPGTRRRIIEQITNWIDDPDTTQYILWLYGPAGSGKSALAQSICELLHGSHPERNGASFFFARGLADRESALKLFTTISYQLAIRFPSVRAEINKALKHDPTLPTKTMEIQLQSLIVQPLLNSKSLLSHWPIIIIDGLDECEDDKDQCDIISLIAKLTSLYKPPLRFMIASRPEYWIRETFHVDPLPRITLSLSLHGQRDTDRDIRTYLTDEFEKIRVKNKRVMGSVPQPWPPRNVVNHFVDEASGQFIYASTVIKFVGTTSKFNHPQEQLRIIISPGLQRAFAFSELDRLYVTIICVYPRWETMKRVLGGLLAYPNTTIVRVFLGVDVDELVMVLDALSSLLDITKFLEHGNKELHSQSYDHLASLNPALEEVFFYHLSFRQFLEDEKRSGPFYINVDGFRDEITQTLFGMIHRSLDQDYEIERYLALNIEFITYQHIMYYVASISLHGLRVRVETLLPLISHMTKRLELVELYPGRSMDSMVRFAEDMRFFECTTRTLFEKKAFRLNHYFWQEEPEDPRETEFHTVCQGFQDAVILTHRRAMHALMQCSEFKVTPVLVYLDEFRSWDPNADLKSIFFKDPDLSRIPGSGTTDAISTVRQYRHILHLYHRCYHEDKSEWTVVFVNLETSLDNNNSPAFRMRNSDEWKKQRCFIIHDLLKSVFSPDWPPDDFHLYHGYNRCSILKNKLFDLNITDLCAEGDLKKAPECLSLLELIGHLPKRPKASLHHPANIMTATICWLYRQLKDQENLKLLEDYDEVLPQRMIATMKYLWETFFLHDFNNSYNRRLILEDHRRCYVEVKALPLPRGCSRHRFPEEFQDSSSDWDSDNTDWPILHEQVFGETGGGEEGSSSSMIDHTIWYPLLASRLLNALSKFLWDKNPLSFFNENSPRLRDSRSTSHDLFEQEMKDLISTRNFTELLPYLIQCLPFAQPTPENLGALRLIVYMYPHVRELDTKLLDLPEGIWLSIAAFLQKYPRSMLSSEELGLFEAWLYSTDHLDISNYVEKVGSKQP